ncbi:MAG TPA: hypothetical protein VD862_02100 [Candidatus Paceibacterota bacterium]|nr:hypothetical protein [Candidatus Paceibacterota bacterium]
MQPLDELIIRGLSGIYTPEFIGFDLFRYSPANITEYFSGRIQLDGVQALLRDMGVAVTLLFLVVTVIGLVKFRGLGQLPATQVPEQDLAAVPVPQGPLAGAWRQVLGYLDSPREADWKLGVLEADKLADAALASAGYAGDGIGERLMNIGPGGLVSLDGLWWAHKLRNRVAHEMEFALRHAEAHQAISYYEQALNELQAI